MASNDKTSRIEDRLLNSDRDISDNTINDKNLTTDFINKETSNSNFNSNYRVQHSVETDVSNKEDSSFTNDNGHSYEKQINSPTSDSVSSDNALNTTYQSIGSGLESDIEDNDSDANPTGLPIIKEPDLSIDDNLPNTVTLLTTPAGGKCYLIGTAHYSIESQNDVSKVIQAVQPHIVVVELCPDRIHVLQLDEETIMESVKNLTFSKVMETIKENGIHKGLFHILLLNMSAYVTKVLGLAPGGEFRRALKEAKQIPNCLVHMGDRPIKITLARALSSLSWWQTIKLAWQLLMERDPINQSIIEKYKSRDTLEMMMAELANKYPALEEVFVKERDIYLTHSLQLACKTNVGMHGIPVPPRVVGIVGIGHTFGIIANWGKVKRSQIPAIMSIPPPSMSSKVLKFTIKASVLGTVIYVGYKLIPIPVVLIQSFKSSVEGLFKTTHRHTNVVSMDATYCNDQYEHPLSDVMYVSSNIPGPGSLRDDFELEFSVGCSCKQECKSNCSCVQGINNYIDNRLLIENKKSVIECNYNCTCNKNCGNRVVQYGPLNCLKIAEATNTIMGMGLFTTKIIKQRQFVCEYAGEIIGIDEAKRRFEENKREGYMNYVLVVTEHTGEKKLTTCIDPSKFGNIGRYANHSCQPNTMLVPVRVDVMVPKLCLFATKDIEPMEEITFNYAGEAANSVHNLSETPCLCGSAVCVGYLPHYPV